VSLSRSLANLSQVSMYINYGQDCLRPFNLRRNDCSLLTSASGERVLFDNSVTALNVLADLNWELVGAWNQEDSGARFYFKRIPAPR